MCARSAPTVGHKISGLHGGGLGLGRETGFGFASFELANMPASEASGYALMSQTGNAKCLFQNQIQSPGINEDSISSKL